MRQLAEPLPECGHARDDGIGCGRPTRRAVYENTGGLCTACAAWHNAVSVLGPQGAAEAVDQLRDWQQTVARIRRAEIIAAAERRHRKEVQRAQRR